MNKQQAAEAANPYRTETGDRSPIFNHGFIAGWEAREARQSPGDAVAFAEWCSIKGWIYKPDDKIWWNSTLFDDRKHSTKLLYTVFNPSGAAPQSVSVEEIQKFYTDWCKQTKRNGGVLIGSSIWELLTALSEALITPQAVGSVWVKGAPPFGVWIGWYQWDDENTMPCILTVSENTEGLFYDVNGIKVVPSRIVKYLSDSDNPQQLFTREQVTEMIITAVGFISDFKFSPEAAREYMDRNYPEHK